MLGITYAAELVIIHSINELLQKEAKDGLHRRNLAAKYYADNKKRSAEITPVFLFYRLNLPAVF